MSNLCLTREGRFRDLVKISESDRTDTGCKAFCETNRRENEDLIPFGSILGDEFWAARVTQDSWKCDKYLLNFHYNIKLFNLIYEITYSSLKFNN